MSGWMGQPTADVGKRRIRLENHRDHERWTPDRHKRLLNVLVLSAGAKHSSLSGVLPRETSLENVTLRTTERSD
jgi:hypothetical protein